MQWIVDHWFEIAATARIAVIAINISSRWADSMIVEQLNDVIRSFLSRGGGNAASRPNPWS